MELLQAIEGTGFGTNNYDDAFDMAALYFLQSKCTPKSTLSFPIQQGPKMYSKGEICYWAIYVARECK